MSTSTLPWGKSAGNIRTGVLNRLDTRLVLTAVILLGLFVGLFTFVQLGTNALVGTDGYYHVKMGYLIRQHGLKPDFPWLPMTVLNAGAFYNHHLLYHVYLALFATVDPAVDGGLALTQAGKIASIIMPSLAFLAIWWLLREQDDFTRLFFYNTDAIYTVGLDPTYMELYDADLYDEWVRITQGKVENPGVAISERFGAAYVFSDLHHGNFLSQAAADPGLKEIYRDEHAVIFAVIK